MPWAKRLSHVHAIISRPFVASETSMGKQDEQICGGRAQDVHRQLRCSGACVEFESRL